ncbi:hypothetical protein [Methylotuvimicrobium sp. KM1]|uniref:hypothetical protein n=1 Tax=Methylotuvimicrobium sp. KM1 TaxID=3377707 RepID=UPI00384C372A
MTLASLFALREQSIYPVLTEKPLSFIKECGLSQARNPTPNLAKSDLTRKDDGIQERETHPWDLTVDTKRHKWREPGT